jgi:alanine dehydrogenase
MEKSTYLITRSQVENAFEMRDYVATIEDAFKLYGQGQVQMPAKVYLTFERGDLRSMPAYLPSMKIAGVKNVNVHSCNKAFPTVMATISLFDIETGFVLTVMDGTHITKMRTGAAGAVAAKYLSKEDSSLAAFIGAGVQAQTQLDGLLITRPGICKLTAYDINEKHMRDFAEYANIKYGLDTELAKTVKQAVHDADIVTTTTPVRKPVVKAEYIRPGTHINAIGADASGKQELDPQILKKARVVIDNWQQASHSGEINVAISKGIISKDDIYADIGQIVTGQKAARQSANQITVFDSTGLAIQDISAAGRIYEKLTSDPNLEAKLEKISFMA